MIPWRGLAAILLIGYSPLAAQDIIDDSDLSPRGFSAQEAQRLGAEGRRAGKALVFPLSPAQAPVPIPGAARSVTGTLTLADRKGTERPARLSRARLVGPGASESWADADPSGRFSLPVGENLSGTYRVRFSLDNRFWAFKNPAADASYEWESQAFSLPSGAGLDLGALQPDPASENGKLGVLHLAYLEALDLLQAQAGVSWWKNPLTVNWPGEANFFSPWGWSLTLTDPLAWDVDLHELGHAVQHGAMKAEPAGGQHKIDECYSPALAWSEGWATFFAGAVRLSQDDPDAKFEFLVPRRAPIRIENVPGDVCKGESSEWRVAAGLWDLLDTHEDGSDRFSMPFSRLWHGLAGESMGSLGSAWALISKELNPVERAAAEGSLIQNTLLPPRPALAVRMPAVPEGWLNPAR